MRIVIRGALARVLMRKRTRRRKSGNTVQGSRRVERFEYPFTPTPRIAVLVEGFRGGGPVKVIPEFTSLDFDHLPVETIAAPVEVLRQIAMPGRSLRYPIVAFSGISRGCVTAMDRELFWRAFGVPTFEQFLGPDGEVLAEECEAHDGLHVRTEECTFELQGRELMVRAMSTLAFPNHHLSTGLAGEIERKPCACGRPGPRLRHVTPLYQANAEASKHAIHAIAG